MFLHPGMILKSIMAKEKRSFAFVLMALRDFTSGRPWIFSGSKVEVCFSFEEDNLLFLYEVCKDPLGVLGKHPVLSAFDHLRFQVVISHLPYESSHGCTCELVLCFEWSPLCLVDLSIDKKLHVRHKHAELLHDHCFLLSVWV